jgi:hypothetical protein
MKHLGLACRTAFVAGQSGRASALYDAIEMTLRHLEFARQDVMSNVPTFGGDHTIGIYDEDTGTKENRERSAHRCYYSCGMSPPARELILAVVGMRLPMSPLLSPKRAHWDLPED